MTIIGGIMLNAPCNSSRARGCVGGPLRLCA